MTYIDYKIMAVNCNTFSEVDDLLKMIENDYNISNRQYYNLKSIALKAVEEV